MRFAKFFRNKRGDGTHMGLGVSLVITVIVGAIVMGATTGLLDNVVVPAFIKQVEGEESDTLTNIDLNDAADLSAKVYGNQVILPEWEDVYQQPVAFNETEVPGIFDPSISVQGTDYQYDGVELLCIPDFETKRIVAQDTLTVLLNGTALLQKNVASLSVSETTLPTNKWYLEKADKSTRVVTIYFYPEDVEGWDESWILTPIESNEIGVWCSKAPAVAENDRGENGTVSRAASDGRIYASFMVPVTYASAVFDSSNIAGTAASWLYNYRLTGTTTFLVPIDSGLPQQVLPAS